MDFAADLALIAPEIVLSVSGLVLLLVAAWAGDRAATAISIAGCVVLAACFALVAPAVCAGVSGPDTVAFYGQIRSDAFAGFAKLMIYAASGAALVISLFARQPVVLRPIFSITGSAPVVGSRTSRPHV